MFIELKEPTPTRYGGEPVYFVENKHDGSVFLRNDGGGVDSVDGIDQYLFAVDGIDQYLFASELEAHEAATVYYNKYGWEYPYTVTISPDGMITEEKDRESQIMEFI